jgi:hypothetical protein
MMKGLTASAYKIELRGQPCLIELCRCKSVVNLPLMDTHEEACSYKDVIALMTFAP